MSGVFLPSAGDQALSPVESLELHCVLPFLTVVLLLALFIQLASGLASKHVATGSIPETQSLSPAAVGPPVGVVRANMQQQDRLNVEVKRIAAASLSPAPGQQEMTEAPVIIASTSGNASGVDPCAYARPLLLAHRELNIKIAQGPPGLPAVQGAQKENPVHALRAVRTSTIRSLHPWRK